MPVNGLSLVASLTSEFLPEATKRNGKVSGGDRLPLESGAEATLVWSDESCLTLSGILKDKSGYR